jgi:hypothetical protein
MDKGVSTASAEDAKFAIYPITVLSPVLKQIPVPDPAVHYVPKNPTFFVSKMLSSGSACGSIRISSDSPVREALLTFISLLLKMTISHGIFSPPLTTTTSPGTINLASISYSFPSLMTTDFYGMKFSN